ncbi:MAG: hypothetical protein Fur0024_1880 [Patescibacteria group bacterium]
MCVLYGFGDFFMFKGLKNSEASNFSIIFSTRSVFSILGAVIFLGELDFFKNINQVLGSVLILISVILVSVESKKNKI